MTVAANGLPVVSWSWMNTLTSWTSPPSSLSVSRLTLPDIDPRGTGGPGIGIVGAEVGASLV